MIWLPYAGPEKPGDALSSSLARVTSGWQKFTGTRKAYLVDCWSPPGGAGQFARANATTRASCSDLEPVAAWIVIPYAREERYWAKSSGSTSLGRSPSFCALRNLFAIQTCTLMPDDSKLIPQTSVLRTARHCPLKQQAASRRIWAGGFMSTGLQKSFSDLAACGQCQRCRIHLVSAGRVDRHSIAKQTRLVSEDRVQSGPADFHCLRQQRERRGFISVPPEDQHRGMERSITIKLAWPPWSPLLFTFRRH